MRYSGLVQKKYAKCASGAVSLTTPWNVGTVLGGECIRIQGVPGEVGLTQASFSKGGVMRSLTEDFYMLPQGNNPQSASLTAPLGKEPCVQGNTAPFIDAQQYHLRKIALNTPPPTEAEAGDSGLLCSKVKGRDCEEKLRFSSRAFLPTFWARPKSRSPSAKRRLEPTGSYKPPYGDIKQKNTKQKPPRKPQVVSPH